MQFSVMCCTAASPSAFLAQCYNRMCGRMSSSPLLQAIFQSSVKFNRNILSEIDPLQPEGKERFQNTGISMSSETFQKNSENAFLPCVAKGKEKKKKKTTKKHWKGKKHHPQEAPWKYDQSLQFLLNVRCPHSFSSEVVFMQLQWTWFTSYFN